MSERRKRLSKHVRIMCILVILMFSHCFLKTTFVTVGYMNPTVQIFSLFLTEN